MIDQPRDLQARIDELEAESNRLLETVDRMQQQLADNKAAVYWKNEFDRAAAECAQARKTTDYWNAELHAANAECDELMVDATRYRFIRSLNAEQFDSVFCNCPRDAKNEALDRYIDAAMNRERGE